MFRHNIKPSLFIGLSLISIPLPRMGLSKSVCLFQVVDPWGQVIAQCHEGEDVCIAEVDFDYLNKVRREMPVWKHRRHDIYGKVGQQ